MPERILVPFDDSAPARYALNEALWVFSADTIVLLHVIDTAEFSHGAEGGAAESLYEAKKADAASLFQEAHDLADEYNVTLDTVIETGQPWTEIIQLPRTMRSIISSWGVTVARDCHEFCSGVWPNACFGMRPSRS